ncbi:hypothetical protein OG689_41515 [Kitasatospora sp. NBC_00240]|uniref:hypothetical protein n=1 Tax=Kitasatospora sp. NBC_00240 TaxID=2903567 RepID=UPI00225643EA|nr:hypothetical protein [Kitasatospora sp. NBC_00240]MCX5215636.1 hypothetical protein [Kitasatospora sp. NBC_00240]
MDGGLKTAIVSACISGGAALLAIWQARIASAQAQSARDAAAFAERQAVAAEKATKAAEDQVALMRRQLDSEDADRREARGPEFTVRCSGAWRGSNHVRHFEVTQDSGPALASVLVHVEGEGVRGLQVPDPGSAGGVSTEPTFEAGRVARGGSFTVLVVLVETGPVSAATPVHFTFQCQAQDSTDTWRRSQIANVPPPPRISRLR